MEDKKSRLKNNSACFIYACIYQLFKVAISSYSELVKCLVDAIIPYSNIPPDYFDISATSLDLLLMEKARLKNILSMFIDHVATTPNRVAVKKGNLEYTYNDVALGAWIFSKHVNHSFESPGQYIGIYTEQDECMYYGIFGAFLSGMGYLPLSPEYPDDRIEYIISDSGVKVIFTKQKYVNRLRNFVCNTTNIITVEELALSSVQFSKCISFR